MSTIKYLSTTQLAKEHKTEPSQMFSSLKKNGWIYKKGVKWELTNEGRIAGGSTRYNPKFGEFIVWPIDLDLNVENTKQGTLSSTQLGNKFGVSAQKLNLILAELGWIKKSNIGGWDLTDIGRKKGGISMEASGGQPYVIWNIKILIEKNFKSSMETILGNKYNEESIAEGKEEEPNDYRKKYPAKYRTQDGHWVRSRAEAMIDDFLYRNGIAHAYEKKLFTDSGEIMSDFYVLEQHVYIEFWGKEEDQNYRKRLEEKIEIYKREGVKLIQLRNSDLENLDDSLSKELRKFKIKIE